MGFNLKDIDAGVLSHAHSDHSGGILRFFESNDKAKFYFREGTACDCYHKTWIFRYYVGIDRALVRDYSDRIVYADGDYELYPGVMLIPHKNGDFKKLAKQNHLYRKIGHRLVPDDYLHEQSLVFKTDKGLVIFNSCSHAGADHIIREVKETYPGEKIYALVGGFHLYHLPEEEIRALARNIKETGIEKVITGHCSKDRGYEILHDEIGDMVSQMYTGMKIEF